MVKKGRLNNRLGIRKCLFAGRIMPDFFEVNINAENAEKGKLRGVKGDYWFLFV